MSTQQCRCQTLDITSISSTLQAAIRFGNWEEAEFSQTPLHSMTSQRMNTTSSSAETGCPSLLGSHMTNVSSNSLASLILVLSFTSRVKLNQTAKVSPPINGELNITTPLMVILHSIRLTFMKTQASTVGSLFPFGANLKGIVSASVELLSICRSVPTKLVLCPDRLVGARLDARTSQHSPLLTQL